MPLYPSLPVTFGAYLISLSAGPGRCKCAGDVAMATWSPWPARWEGRALLGVVGTLAGSPGAPLCCPAHSCLSMKAYLTLLFHLGRLHETPVPKPRGTPKLSERYAGPERFSGPWRWAWGCPGGQGFLRACDPPHTLLRMGRAHLWLGQECCAHIPWEPLSCGQQCLVETPASGVP